MLSVLIVDDDEDDRDLLCDALTEINPSITCIMARNGEEALLRLKLDYSLKPDLIFLDINMPRINGIQCLTALKKDSALSNIPVAMYTTSKSDFDKDLTAKLGAAHFITKPSCFATLCSELKSILSSQDLVAKEDQH
jgi:CheY-like chemotaxis protein